MRQMVAMFPTLSFKEIHMLRRVTEDYFGWERLLYIGELLGMEPEFTYKTGRKVARRELARAA